MCRRGRCWPRRRRRHPARALALVGVAGAPGLRRACRRTSGHAACCALGTVARHRLQPGPVAAAVARVEGPAHDVAPVGRFGPAQRGAVLPLPARRGRGLPRGPTILAAVPPRSGAGRGRGRCHAPRGRQPARNRRPGRRSARARRRLGLGAASAHPRLQSRRRATPRPHRYGASRSHGNRSRRDRARRRQPTDCPDRAPRAGRRPRRPERAPQSAGHVPAVPTRQCRPGRHRALHRDRTANGHAGPDGNRRPLRRVGLGGGLRGARGRHTPWVWVPAGWGADPRHPSRTGSHRPLHGGQRVCRRPRPTGLAPGCRAGDAG